MYSALQHENETQANSSVVLLAEHSSKSAENPLSKNTRLLVYRGFDLVLTIHQSSCMNIIEMKVSHKLGTYIYLTVSRDNLLLFAFNNVALK